MGTLPKTLHLLARRVNRAKWEAIPDWASPGGAWRWVQRKFTKMTDRSWVPPEAIPAEALAGLEATGNALSLWRCDDTADAVSSVVLAIAAGMERPGPLHLTLLPEDRLRKLGFELAPSPEEAETPIAVLKQLHVDAVRIDAGRFVLFAQVVATAIRSGVCKEFTMNDVVSLLVRAVAEGRVALDDLQGEMREGVAKRVLQSKFQLAVDAAAQGLGLSVADLKRDPKGLTARLKDAGGNDAGRVFVPVRGGTVGLDAAAVQSGLTIRPELGLVVGPAVKTSGSTYSVALKPAQEEALVSAELEFRGSNKQKLQFQGALEEVRKAIAAA